MKCVVFDVDGVLLGEEQYFNASALAVWEILYSRDYMGLPVEQDDFVPSRVSAGQIAYIRNRVWGEDGLLRWLYRHNAESMWDMSHLCMLGILWSMAREYKQRTGGADGDMLVTCNTIVQSFMLVVTMPLGGISGGTQGILGYNYGAEKYDRVRKTYQLILATTLAVGLAATLVFELCPQLVVGIFGQGDPLYWEFAIQTFRIFLSLITFTCFIKMTSIFFQAVGEPGKATAASLIRDLACFVPLALLLPHKFGIQGVLYAGPAADAIAMVVAVVLTVRFFQQMNRQAKKG